MPELFLTNKPDPADQRAIDDALPAYIHISAGAPHKTPLLIILRDENGQFVSGLDGATLLDWLYSENLAVAQARAEHRLAPCCCRRTGSRAARLHPCLPGQAPMQPISHSQRLLHSSDILCSTVPG